MIEESGVRSPESGVGKQKSVGLINENGQVVGGYTGRDGIRHGFLYENGVFTCIDFPDAEMTVARDNDNNGRIVGEYQDGGTIRGFLRDSSGAYITLPSPDDALATSISGINDQGQMTGTYINNSGTHSFLMDRGGFKIIDVPGALLTEAHGINKFGQIVGLYLSGGRVHGFLWVNGSITTITNHPGALMLSAAYDIDDLGRIVGPYL